MKIFCIGSNKTGTTSLKDALHLLGFSTCPISIFFNQSTNLLKQYYQKDYSNITKLINQYDAFHDRPWNHSNFYQTLYYQIPNSLFILSVRNSSNWLTSYQNFAHKIKLRQKWFYKIVSQELYDNNDFLSDPKNMISKYEQRNQEIINFFQNKNNLLIMNIENGDGYQKLCPFLNKPIINQPFPHSRKKTS